MNVGASVSLEEAASADDSSPRHLKSRKITLECSKELTAEGCFTYTLGVRLSMFQRPFSPLPCPSL